MLLAVEQTEGNGTLVVVAKHVVDLVSDEKKNTLLTTVTQETYIIAQPLDVVTELLVSALGATTPDVVGDLSFAKVDASVPTGGEPDAAAPVTG